MKILVLSHRVPFPPNKGEKIRTFHQLQYLNALGYEIHLFSPYDDDAELQHFSSLQNLFCQSVSAKKLQKKSIRFANGLLSGKPLSISNFYSTHLQKELDQFLATNNVSAILCSASSMAEYVFKSQSLANATKKPLLIMDFMDVDSDKWGQYKRNSSLPMSWVYGREQRLLAQYERKIVAHFDACYLIAQAEVSLFNQTVAKSQNVHVLGNGIDNTTFHPARNKVANSHPVLLFTGVMDYKPNIDAVVWFIENCWLKIVSQNKGAKFIIAGMNPSNEVLKLANVEGIEVTGYVEDILPYYHQADIFVAPFRLARGVQNKVLQAFSCGLPVVSSPMGAEGISCTPQRNILVANDAAEFIKQIQVLIEDPTFASQVGSQAEQLISQHYSWQGQLHPLQTLLTNLREKDETAP